MKSGKIFLMDVCALFCLLTFVFLPLTLNSKDFQFRFSLFIFEKLTSYIQNQYFSSAISNIDFSSDTIALNILLAILLVLSVLVILFLKLSKINLAWLRRLFFTISPYYVGLILLKYGIDKVALQQFSIPEPNILYTPFGYLDKDILFWSTIGTSKFYNISVGIIEIMCSVFLLFSKTRILGFCIALGIILNILIINIGFDISVKTLSAFLILVILTNLYPFIKPLYFFFIANKPSQLHADRNYLHFPYHRLVKICLVTFIVFFACYPYLINVFANKQLEKVTFNKAYEVKDNGVYKRVFFNKGNYIIFQTLSDEMIDYHYKIDSLLKKITIEDYQNRQFKISYKIDKSGVVELQLANNTKLLLQPITWENLPALQDGIHYTIDEIR